MQSSLPEGVEVVPVYDRSELIQDAVRNLTHKLGEEFLVVALVCLLFLWHLRSALVAVITLPLGILAAFIVMHAQDLRQLAVIRRHRHRHWCDGRCSGGDDRKCTQASGALAGGARPGTSG